MIGFKKVHLFVVVIKKLAGSAQKERRSGAVMDKTQKNEGKLAGAPLKPSLLRSETYCHEFIRPLISWSPRGEEDNPKDDVQPRYQFWGEIKSRDNEVLIDGEGMTILDASCRVTAWLYRRENERDTPPLCLPDDRPELRHLVGKCKDASSLFAENLPFLRDSLDSSQPRARLIEIAPSALIVLSLSFDSLEELTGVTNQVRAYLYNVFLPAIPFDSTCVQRDESKEMPEGSQRLFEACWGRWDLIFYALPNHKARKEALLKGWRGVPTGFVQIRGGGAELEAKNWKDLRKELARLAIALRLATLNSVEIRFWEYQESKHHLPYARVHVSSITSCDWNDNCSLIPDRRSLRNYLSVMAVFRVFDRKWWYCAASHLIASCRLKDQSVGNLHGAFSYVYIALDTITHNFPNDTEASLASARTCYESLKKGPKKKKKTRGGFGRDVTLLEDALGIRTDASGREDFERDLGVKRGLVLHEGKPPLDGQVGRFKDQTAWLSLCQLHVARILLEIIGYKGYFQVPNLYTYAMYPHLNVLFHTDKPVPCRTEDLMSRQQDIGKELWKSLHDG